jgi:hypothetical protein
MKSESSAFTFHGHDMTGLEMSHDLIAERERATYAPLDNPDRRHEPDGVCVPELPTLGIALPNPALVEEAPQKMDRQSVLLEAQSLVHGDRNQQYGAPAEEYRRTVGMVNAMLAGKLKEPLAPEDLAYIMVCLKLSRQINKAKRDSLVDAAGYCEVAQWILDSE